MCIRLLTCLIVVAALSLAPAASADIGCNSSGTATVTVVCSVGIGDHWIVPAGVSTATFVMHGAAGGADGVSGGVISGAGGMGGGLSAGLSVAHGSDYQIDVGHVGAPSTKQGGGSGGAPGGAAGSGFCYGGGQCVGGGGGGGASIVGLGGDATFDWMLVAGGGGGAGSYGYNGGAGGGRNGEQQDSCGGAGGGQTPGSGSGIQLDGSQPGGEGGGGGGGFYGGAGAPDSCGGGGGSGFINAQALPGSAFVPTTNHGSGTVTITYTPAAPPTASITNPASNQTFNLDEIASTSFTCKEGAGGTALDSCLDQNGHTSGGSLDTSSVGQHTLTATATSDDGLTGTASATYNVVSPPKVSISAPASGQTFSIGQVTTTSFACVEGASGALVLSCLDQNGNPSGALLDTSTAGHHSLTVTGISNDGIGTASVTYSVAAPPTVSIATPGSDQAFSFGQIAATSFTCSDGYGGSGISSCADQNAQPSGAALDTSSAGAHTLTVTATSKDGQTANASVNYTVSNPVSGGTVPPTITTVPPTTSTGPTSGPSGPVPSPAIVSHATQTATSWREPRKPKLAQISRVSVGTTLRFTLDQAATVRFAFTQRVSSVKVAGKCVARNKHNKHKPKCSRTMVAGTLTFPAHAGVNTVRFEGRVSGTNKLRPGRYTLLIIATAASRASKPASLTFTIVN